jgi:cell division transport system ATP-binding protein
MIEMHDVRKVYGNGVAALRGVTIKIEPGEFVYIVGTSGSGKSTLIKLMYREEHPTTGVVLINGINVNRVRDWKIPYLRRKIGVVFQDFKLLPKMTALENVAFAVEAVGQSRKKALQRSEELLQLVGLQERLNSFPKELSGGEQQRVAIARAIANKPAFVIADEPTGNLDPESSWDIMYLLEEINNNGTTVVMATHNREIVNTLRQRVVVIEQGLIVRDEQGGDYGYDD